METLQAMLPDAIEAVENLLNQFGGPREKRWRELPLNTLLFKSQEHQRLHLLEDPTEAHIVHQAARALMALQVWLEIQKTHRHGACHDLATSD